MERPAYGNILVLSADKKFDGIKPTTVNTEHVMFISLNSNQY